MTSRGIRNNNPGNIRHGASKWQGLSAAQPDKDFCTFDTPELGIRALVKVLLAYQQKYNCTSISTIIKRYAPPNENNTEIYIKHCCSATGIDRYQPIDVRRYDHCFPLVACIIRHECGVQPYASATIEEGLRLAGVTR